MFSQACDHIVPVTISLRQFPEQRHSEDVSLSTPIVNASMSALSPVTERVNPEAQGQYSRLFVESLVFVAMLPSYLCKIVEDPTTMIPIMSKSEPLEKAMCEQYWRSCQSAFLYRSWSHLPWLRCLQRSHVVSTTR